MAGALTLSPARGIASALPVSWSVQEKCSSGRFLSASSVVQFFVANLALALTLANLTFQLERV